MRYISIQQTPQYSYNGSVYTPVGSVPVGTELTFSRIYTDGANGRQVGVLADGKLMFVDSLAPLLDDVVQVTAKRMYLGLWIVGGLIAAKYGYEWYKKNYKKPSAKHRLVRA